MNPILLGMLIIDAYDSRAIFYSSNDRVWFGSFKTKDRMTSLELTRLEKLGWGENNGYWSHVTNPLIK